MLLIRKTFFTLLRHNVLIALLFLFNAPANAQNPGDSLHYPIHDRRGDDLGFNSRYNYNLSPSNLTDSVVYDYQNHRYIVYEKIGNIYYRTPTTYTFEEYWELRNRQMEREYFQSRANSTSILN